MGKQLPDYAGPSTPKTCDPAPPGFGCIFLWFGATVLVGLAGVAVMGTGTLANAAGRSGWGDAAIRFGVILFCVALGSGGLFVLVGTWAVVSSKREARKLDGGEQNASSGDGSAAQ